LQDGWRGLPAGLRRTLVFILIVLAFWNLPLFVYRPFCTDMWGLVDSDDRKFVIGRREMPPWAEEASHRNEIEIKGTMNDVFTEWVDDSLSWWGIWHLRIGRTILIPFSEWTFGSDGLSNSTYKSISYLSRHLELLGSPPSELREMIAREEALGDVINDCEIVRAIAMENWGR
jgi:hypothetical protein